MPASDIYNVKESPWAKAQQEEPKSGRRKRRRTESFDDVVNKDLSKTHSRRSKNSGFRRLRHQLKKPEFSKKFWTITVAVFVIIFGSIVLWDQFFRYSEPEAGPTSNPFESSIE